MHECAHAHTSACVHVHTDRKCQADGRGAPVCDAVKAMVAHVIICWGALAVSAKHRDSAGAVHIVQAVSGGTGSLQVRGVPTAVEGSGAALRRGGGGWQAAPLPGS